MTTPIVTEIALHLELTSDPFVADLRATGRAMWGPSDLVLLAYGGQRGREDIPPVPSRAARVWSESSAPSHGGSRTSAAAARSNPLPRQPALEL